MVPSSLFILASCVCKSLQCLISTLIQGAKVVTYFSSLVQLCRGEGGTLQISLSCVGSACSVWTTLVLPQPKAACFPGLHCSGSRVLCKGTVPSGPVFPAFPRSKPLRFSGTLQGNRPHWTCILCPSQVQAAQTTRSLANALSLVSRVS